MPLPPQWKVVGGQDKGGILVREEQALASVAIKERLATGSIVEEISLVGERLNYRLLTGSGPRRGWVSLQVGGKELLVLHKADEPPPAAPRPPVEPRNGILSTPARTAPAAPTASKPQREAAVEEPRAAPLPPGVDHAFRRRLDTEARVRRKAGDFSRYCLKYRTLGYPLPDCKLRILCFPSAGGAESMYTSPGAPLVEWAKETKTVEVCALDFPGRNKLLKARKHTSAGDLAFELLSVVHDVLSDGVPYVVWAHSVGTWAAFELLLQARSAGLPMPRAAFLMAFPAPHLPEAERPWRRSAGLDDEEFREELRGWDREHFEGAGRTAFELGWEGTWEPMLRADFRLFDEYEFRHAAAKRFDFPIHAWHFDGDHRVRPEMTKMWAEWTSGAFEHRVLEGMGHLTCFYKKDLKQRYFEQVTEVLRGYAGQSGGAAA